MELTELKDRIAQRGKRVREAMQSWRRRQINAYYHERYAVVAGVLFEHPKLSVTMDAGVGAKTYSVVLGHCDQWNNRQFTFSEPVPPTALLVMGEYLEDFGSAGEGQYPHRETQALLIAYWTQMFMQLTAGETMLLLNVSDRLQSEDRSFKGFRAWLTTRSYRCCEGGAVNDGEFRNWPDRKLFWEMFHAANNAQ